MVVSCLLSLDTATADTGLIRTQPIPTIQARQPLLHVMTPSNTQAEIQAEMDTYGVVYLLPGTYNWDTTFTMPRKYGCALIGLGGSHAYVASSPIAPGLISAGAVKINWTGASSATMIRVLGAEFRIDGINLIGSDKTQKGVLVENGDPNTFAVRGGKGYIPHLTGMNLDCVIQFGLEDNGDNGDVTSVGRLTGYDCNAIVRVLGGLSFELHFDYVRNARCPIVFDCQYGGGLHCRGGQVLGNVAVTLLKIAESNPTASSYVIEGIHVDSPAASSGFKLVEATERSWADITIQAHLPEASYPVPIAELIGPMSLNLRRCSNLRPGAVEGTTDAAGNPVVVADNCRLRGTWSLASDLLTSAGTAVMNDCYSHTGVIFVP